MLNHIVLMGRLTRDPELRRTGSGIAVASFTLAVDRDFASQGGEKETDFVDIVAWRSDGRVRQQVLHEGPHGCRLRPAADPQLAATKRATSAAALKSWPTTSTSENPSATAWLRPVSTRRRRPSRIRPRPIRPPRLISQR